MADLRKVTLNIGVPLDGTPSVFSVTVRDHDSLGDLDRSLAPSEKLMIAKALIAFLGTLLE